jgi:hypothetical protein
VLRSAKVPAGLRHLIPLAKRFGVTDDLDRERLVATASPEEVARLKAAVSAHDDDLDEWLAGPEAEGSEFSAEYLAFSALRMAADFA